MRLRDLLETVIQQCHVHPERLDWPVCVGVIEYGAGYEYTILSPVEPSKKLEAFFVTAVPQSSL